ncbi:DUF742 domain-containing protein [Thermobifida alba]|nr:DUF742 domain-containing protein [Thermobifida alba]
MRGGRPPETSTGNCIQALLATGRTAMTGHGQTTVSPLPPAPRPGDGHGTAARWEIGSGLPHRCPPKTRGYVGRRRRNRPPVTELHRVRVHDPGRLLPVDLPRPAAVVYASCLRAGPAGARVVDLAVDAGLPLGTTAVLVGLLREAALVVDVPPARVDRALLERVLVGLRSL